MANPTTNYGWVMPAATDLVTDLPADFDVFGQAVDTDFIGLLGGTTGQVLAKASGTDLDFVWSADAAGMTNPMTTTADIIYSTSGSTPGRLGIGATGDLLTVAGGVPTWAAPAGGGKVLQVVMGTTSTGTSIATTTFTDTTLTASITPSSVDSEILVLYSQQYQMYRAADTLGNGLQLLRGATAIQGYGQSGKYSAFHWGGAGAGGAEYRVVVGGNYLDSPATTSATAYKIQLALQTTSNSASLYAQSDSSLSTMILMEIGA